MTQTLKSVKRRGPKKGYDNKSKSEYRNRVWETLSKKCKPVLKQSNNAKVLLLPSKEGIEIDVAINYGIKPEQIIAIDENPAVIAVSKWRKKYPNVNYFGCKVSEVGPKIESNGWILAAANLDFCNQFSEEIINEINSFLNSTPIYESFSFFITMAKGRESSGLCMLLKNNNSPGCFMHPRLGVLYQMLIPNNQFKEFLSIDFQAQYTSSRMPMIYACFSFKRREINNFLKGQIKELNKSIRRINNIKLISAKLKRRASTTLEEQLINKKEKILLNMAYEQLEYLGQKHSCNFIGFLSKLKIINRKHIISKKNRMIKWNMQPYKWSRLKEIDESKDIFA